MLPKIFDGAKVGDEVFSANNGWGKIRRLCNAGINDNYPVDCKFDNDSDTYTIEGCIVDGDIAPICWPAHLVPQYYLDLCPRPKRKVVKTIERWANVYANGLGGICDSLEEAKRRLSYDEPLSIVHLTGTYEVEE